MKRLALIMLALILIPGLAVAGEKNPWQKPLPFKEATITYVLAGMEQGSEVMYIKDKGERQAVHHTGTTSMMGMTMETKTIEITEPDWIYSYDLTEGTGLKSVNPNKCLSEEYNKLSRAEKKQVLKNIEIMGNSTMASMGGTVQKNVTEILGYDCDKASVMGSTVYLIHDTDIPLKTEVTTMGMNMTITATDIDKGGVSEKYFEHPANIQAIHDTQADAMTRSMAQQTMEMLKDPEGAKQPSNATQQQRMEQIPEEDREEMQQAMEMMKGLFGN